MQTTHAHAQVCRYTHKLGHTNPCWQLALAMGGGRVDDNEWEKLGKREKKERNKGAQERGS